MIKILQTLINCIFAPLAALAGLGALRFVIVSILAKRWWSIGVFIYAIILFFLFRDAEISPSGRYMIIAVPAAALFAVYALYATGVQRAISRLLLAGTVIFMIGKDLRYNRFSGSYALLGSTIKADAEKFRHPVIADFTGRDQMWEWYSEVKNVVKAYLPPDKSLRGELWRYMLDYRYRGDVLYLIATVRAKEKPFTETDICSPDGEWTLLSENFISNRKNKKLVLYRFVPRIFTPATAENLAAHRAKPGMIPGNAGFERSAPPAPETVKILTERGLGVFPRPELRFPADWEPNTAHGWKAGCSGEVELAASPFSGCGSALRMSSRDLISVVSSSGITASGGRRISVETAVETNVFSRFGVMLYYFDAGKWQSSDFSGYVSAHPGESGLYRFSFQPPPGAELRPGIVLASGDIRVDEIKLFSDDGGRL